MAAGERPRFLFEPGRVRVGARGVGAIKQGSGSGRGGCGKGGGQGKGRGQAVSLAAAFSAISTARGQSGTSSAPATAITVLNYTEKTTTVTVTGTVEGTPTVVITASAGIVVDGSTLICAEFYAPDGSPTAGASVLFNLWDDTAGVSLGRLWASSNGVATTSEEVFARRYFTPAAGTRTYSVRGWRTSANYTVTAGAGGAVAYFPMYLRLTSGG